MKIFITPEDMLVIDKFFLFFSALMFVQKNFDGSIPAMELTDDDKKFIALINKELKTYIDNLSSEEIY